MTGRTFQDCKFKGHLFILDESSVYVLHQQAITSSSGVNLQLHKSVFVSANIGLACLGYAVPYTAETHAILTNCSWVSLDASENGRHWTLIMPLGHE